MFIALYSPCNYLMFTRSHPPPLLNHVYCSNSPPRSQSDSPFTSPTPDWVYLICPMCAKRVILHDVVYPGLSHVLIPIHSTCKLPFPAHPIAYKDVFSSLPTFSPLHLSSLPLSPLLANLLLSLSASRFSITLPSARISLYLSTPPSYLSVIQNGSILFCHTSSLRERR